MLAGFKTQRTRCVARPHRQYKYQQGFFADDLHATLIHLPEHLWTTKRRKRSYVNQVLARGEVHSAYQPARRLWVRIVNGHYLPNPALLLRTHTGGEGPGWRPVFEALNLPWVADGTTATDHFYTSVTTLVESALRRAQGDDKSAEMPNDAPAESDDLPA